MTQETRKHGESGRGIQYSTTLHILIPSKQQRSQFTASDMLRQERYMNRCIVECYTATLVSSPDVLIGPTGDAILKGSVSCLDKKRIHPFKCCAPHGALLPNVELLGSSPIRAA